MATTKDARLQVVWLDPGESPDPTGRETEVAQRVDIETPVSGRVYQDSQEAFNWLVIEGMLRQWQAPRDS